MNSEVQVNFEFVRFHGDGRWKPELNLTIATQQLNYSHFNYKSITSAAALFRLMDQGPLHFLLGSELIKTHTKLIKSAG